MPLVKHKPPPALPLPLAVLELTRPEMEILPEQTLRIIDANVNRIGEGLRVLDDVSRLLLNSSDLSQRLKNLRHELVRTEPAKLPGTVLDSEKYKQARFSLYTIEKELMGRLTE